MLFCSRAGTVRPKLMCSVWCLVLAADTHFDLVSLCGLVEKENTRVKTGGCLPVQI